MNDLKRDMMRIQELIGNAFRQTGSLVALTDGGQMNPNKLQKTLEQTMEQFEAATLELRKLCERYAPGSGGFAKKPILPSMDVTGSVEAFGYGWLHITINTLLPHCRYQSPNWLSDTIRRLLDSYEACGKELPFFERAMLIIDEHTAMEGRHIFDQDNKGWKAVSNAIKGRLIPDDDQHIVLLDEIFKCNDGVLNSLLTALNERKYTNEGRTYPIPVISFFAASNEIPNFNDPQEKILEALYDRLELKVVTANMEDRDTRLAVLKNKQAGTFGQVTATITLEELRQMQQEVASILVPDAINELADDILCELRKDMAVSDRKYLGYYPIAQAKAWLSGHDKVESCDLLALKNYLWRLPSDREKVEAVLTRLCVNPMQDKVNNIRGMALESQEEFDAALGDGSKADTVRKAFIKLRGELTHLYQMQCSLRTAAQSDSETALVDDLLADLEKISRKAHEQTHFTYTTLEEIAALN